MNSKRIAHASRKRTEELGISKAGVGAEKHPQQAGDPGGTAQFENRSPPGGTNRQLGPRGPAVVGGISAAGRALRRARPSQQRIRFLEGAGSSEVGPAAHLAVETVQASRRRAGDGASGAGGAGLTSPIRENPS